MSAPGTIKPVIIGKVVLYFVGGIIVIFVAVMLFLRFQSVEKVEVFEEKVVTSQYTSFEMELVVQAQRVFEAKKEEGWDFSNGPCLSNNLLGEWVIDVAHSPREAIDDLPENQCTAYLTKKITHFIELDPEGNLIRLK